MAALVFWSAVVLVAYAYAGYPCALALLARARRRPARAAGLPATWPRVTFVITAHNEEPRLRAKIENTLGQRYPVDALEVVVASDCSTDRTDAIAAEYAPRVRLVRQDERRGKEAAQALAVAGAEGDVLVFSDVATALAPEGVAAMVAHFADPTVGCVSSVDRFVDEDGRLSGEGAYVRYEMFLRALESRAHTLVGLSGSFFAARRAVCRRWATDRQSDFGTLLEAVRLGLRGVLAEGAAGYYRNIRDDRREFPRKVRTVLRGLQTLAASADMLDPFRHGLFAWQLASHKLARWLVPFAMIAAAASNLLLWRSPFYAATLAAQCAFYAAAAVGWRTQAGWLRLPAYLVQANLAVLVAWIRFARGDRITVWNPSDRLAALPSALTR